MDDNGWYFPSTFQDYSKDWTSSNGVANGEGWNENGVENDIHLSEADATELMVGIPLQFEPPKVEDTKKKKKKRKNFKAETFHDKYTVSTQVLGRGAHSLVALCEENETNKKYAVKVIEKYEGYDRSRVLREIDLLHFLADCPNVLQLYDSYEESEEFYLVFKRMEGGPLLDHIQQQTHFTEKCASIVVWEIAQALQFLHDKGISHRDLKPDNILCVEKDKVHPVVICDFNLASGIGMIGSATTPDLYTPVGSAEFMAPEVVDAFVGDAPAYDKRCDLWSLGVILYIMLAGKPPFTGNCGQGCDWDIGGSCRDCQSLLWHNILDANYSFPEDDWQYVSQEAKDLISHLLVKEASKRYTVDCLLAHPWFEVASENELNTPLNLTRSSSKLSLSNFASEAVAYRRIISERQSSQDEVESDMYDLTSRWSTPPKFGLSPPGKSRLAKRRSLKKELKLKLGSSSDNNSIFDASSPIGLRASAILNKTWNCEALSPGNKTPVQSPAKDFSRDPLSLDLRLKLDETDGECLTPRATEKYFGANYKYVLDATPPASSDDVTPEMTPRDENMGSHTSEVENTTSLTSSGEDITPNATSSIVKNYVRKKLDILDLQ